MYHCLLICSYGTVIGNYFVNSKFEKLLLSLSVVLFIVLMRMFSVSRSEPQSVLLCLSTNHLAISALGEL